MDIKKAAELFARLHDHLEKYGGKDLEYQAKIAKDAAASLNNELPDKEKENIVRTYYRILWPGNRGGLSDAVLWDEDIEKRKALNGRVEQVRKELKELIDKQGDASGIKVIGLDRPAAGRTPINLRSSPPGPVPAASTARKENAVHSKKRVYLFPSAIVMCCCLLSFFVSAYLGREGKYVLHYLVVHGLAACGMGSCFSYVMNKLERERIDVRIVSFIIGFLLIVYGEVMILNVARDYSEPPKETVLYNCEVVSLSGGHGIIGLRHNLTGKDRSGKIFLFPISVTNADEYAQIQTARIQYYEHTGMLLSLQREETAMAPISFGDLEKGLSQGFVTDARMVILIMLRDNIRNVAQAKRMLNGFDTIVYIKGFKIQEITEIDGFDAKTEENILRPVYRRDYEMPGGAQTQS